MTSKRTSWSRMTYLEKLYTLKSNNVRRELAKDYGRQCIVEGCGKFCRKGEDCYLPSYNPNTLTNEVIAHLTCVDLAIADHKAQSTKAAKASEAKKLEADGILVVLSESDIDNQLQRLIEAAAKEGYERGFKAGRQSVNTKLAEKIAALNAEMGH